MNTRTACTLAGAFAVILCMTGAQTFSLVYTYIYIRLRSAASTCDLSVVSTHLTPCKQLLAAVGVSAGPTCTTTSGSPKTADCNAVAAYLQQLPSTQQCVRTSAGTGDCTPMQTIGTCVASICGSMGNSIACSDAGADVSTLAVSCASGGTGSLESTTAAGSLIPYGNGNLQITISHS